MAKTKVVANSPLTGEVTVVNGTNVAAPASMKASGSTLDSIKECARQELSILLKAEEDRGNLWRKVIFEYVRVKEDWQAYARELHVAIADHFTKLENEPEESRRFDFTKNLKAWPEWASKLYVSRFQNQVAQVKRIETTMNVHGVQHVKDTFLGKVIRLDDNNNFKKLEAAPKDVPSLQSVVKNLARDHRGRRSAPQTPTVPQKATVEAAVTGQAAAEFAQPVQAQASEQSKESLAKVAMEHSAKVLTDLIGKCPGEYLPGMLTAVSTRLNDELAPEFKNLAVAIHKAVTEYRERKEGKAPAKKVKQPKAPKAEAKAA